MLNLTVLFWALEINNFNSNPKITEENLRDNIKTENYEINQEYHSPFYDKMEFDINNDNSSTESHFNSNPKKTKNCHLIIS